MSAISHPAPAIVRRPFRALRFTRDEELVRLVRAGDERAFEVLYDRHHRGILAFCRHMLGSADEAEDAVQHSFIAAHRDLVGSDKPIQLKAWLYTIARNRCLSVLRARKDERALDEVPEPSVRGLGAEVQQRQDLRDLLADLQRLPEDQRAALVLSELGALSHEEIGATLGVRKDKVKALVFQARESLASSRSARDADCREIQEQLSVLRGGSLRRTTLRRHVEVCPACAAFKAEVKLQRSAMAAVLPVVPSLALKESVLAAVFGGGGGGGIIGGGLLAASGTKALVAKVTTVAVVAGGATGGGLVAVDQIAGGGGTTATAMAGLPPEQGPLRIVDAVRELTRGTGPERVAGRGGVAGQGASAPSTSDSQATSGERRVRGRTRAERRGAAVRLVDKGARGKGKDKPKDGENARRDGAATAAERAAAQRRRGAQTTDAATTRGRGEPGQKLSVRLPDIALRTPKATPRAESTVAPEQALDPVRRPAGSPEHDPSGDAREKVPDAGGAASDVTTPVDDAATAVADQLLRQP